MVFNLRTKTSEYMTVMVTHECNRNCPFCIDKLRGSGEYISKENVEKAISFAKSKGIKDILLLGGEPTLHPNIYSISKRFKEEGFRTILTTNFDDLEKVYSLGDVIDCFNFSYYGQKRLPEPERFNQSDLTLTTLIFKGKLDTKDNLDKFIDTHEGKYTLKFSTLSVCNEYTERKSLLGYLDELPDCEYVVLFNEILGQIYRNHVIKRYDKVINPNAKQSYKFHTNGKITKSWD